MTSRGAPRLRGTDARLPGMVLRLASDLIFDTESRTCMSGLCAQLIPEERALAHARIAVCTTNRTRAIVLVPVSWALAAALGERGHVLWSLRRYASQPTTTDEDVSGLLYRAAEIADLRYRNP